MSIVYTVAEKTEKKLDYNFLIKQAGGVLKDKYNKHHISSDFITEQMKKQLFTVEEANNLIERIINDTLYA